MALPRSQGVEYLNSLTPAAEARFLALLGHQLTLAGREAYEAQGPGVADPGWLRDLNELNHRLYPHIAALVGGQPPHLPNAVLLAWLLPEDKPPFRAAALAAFARAIDAMSHA